MLEKYLHNINSPLTNPHFYFVFQSSLFFRDQVNSQTTFEKDYIVTPLLANNKEKYGLALDSRLKDEDTNLASSTM